jgi:hypothetical protein
MKIKSTNMEIEIVQQTMLIQWKMKPTKTVMECEFEPPKLDTMGVLLTKCGANRVNPTKGSKHIFSSLSDLSSLLKLGSWGSTLAQLAHNKYNSAFSLNIYTQLA